jgi:hypothetical protein
MEVIHRVSFSDEAGRRHLLSSLDIRFKTSESPLVRTLWFDIDETHPAWGQVRELMAKSNAGDIVQTRFTTKELNEAEYLQMTPDWHYGYPQPERKHGFLAATYDLSDYCSACGIGRRQNAPFQMKGEPKWGKRQILQLNWVFDEFFVYPAVWESVFEPFGLEPIPKPPPPGK